jgi:hypothetical protein
MRARFCTRTCAARYYRREQRTRWQS